MKVNVNRRKVLGSVLAGAVLQGCGGGGGGGIVSSSGSGSIQIPTRAPTSAPTPAPSPVPTPAGADTGPTLSTSLGQPLYIAHRGASAMYPEETFVAYDESLRNSQVLLEGDVQTLRDGELAVMHDATVDRTTTSTGNLSLMTQSDFVGLRADGDAWNGSNYGNDLAVPLFRDWVQRYRGKAILIPEDKDTHSMAAMMAVFEAFNVSRDQALVQCSALGPLGIATAAGYQTCLIDSGAGDPASAIAAGVGWAGISVSAKDADLKKWIASGIRVLLWTVSRRFQRDQYLAMGVAGFFSDDPQYMQATKALSKTDLFATGTWAPGMLGNGGDTALALRGQFFSNGYWGYASNASGYAGCLHGYLCPMRASSDPRAFQIDLKVTFDSAFNLDGTRFASVFAGTDDKPFQDGTEWSEGYHFVLRKNGILEIQKKALGAKSVMMRSSADALPINDGEQAFFRITVTDTSLTVARLNVGGSILISVSVNDGSLRTTYLSLGRNGLACRFKDVAIS